MLAVTLMLLLSTQAPSHHDDADHAELAIRHSPERGEIDTDNGISARIIGGVAPESDAPLFGVGVAYERDFFHCIIAVEWAFEALTTNGDNVLLFEMVIEKPVELSEDVALYFGGGPTLLVHAPKRGQVQPGWGGLSLVGVEYDLGAGFDVFVELDTALFFLDKPVVEADVGTGVMWRF